MKPAASRIPSIDSRAPGWMAVTRGAALGLSVLMALNLIEVFVHSTSAVENWLSNLSPLPQPVAITALAMASTAFLMFSMKPALPGPVWFVSIGCVVLFAGFCGREFWQNTQMEPAAAPSAAMTRPLGTVMLFAVAGIGIALGNAASVRGRSSFLAILFSAVLAIGGFAVVQVQSGEISDPLPQSEVPVILVLGCPLDSDGKASESLADRVKTGSRLLLEKHGKRLVLSGGPGHGAVTESEVMRQLATSAGVAETLIVTDSNAGSPAGSIRFCASRPELKDDRGVICVSHWYQLARIRLLARRSGLTVSAIAAKQEHALFHQNQLVAREVADLLVAYCEPAVGLVRGTGRPADALGSDQPQGAAKQ